MQSGESRGVGAPLPGKQPLAERGANERQQEGTAPEQGSACKQQPAAAVALAHAAKQGRSSGAGAALAGRQWSRAQLPALQAQLRRQQAQQAGPPQPVPNQPPDSGGARHAQRPLGSSRAIRAQQAAAEQVRCAIGEPAALT